MKIMKRRGTIKERWSIVILIGTTATIIGYFIGALTHNFQKVNEATVAAKPIEVVDDVTDVIKLGQLVGEDVAVKRHGGYTILTEKRVLVTVVTSKERLSAGTLIGFVDNDGTEVSSQKDNIIMFEGFVDPFLPANDIEPGERFLMVLNPNSPILLNLPEARAVE